jgi:hypothetical protein
MHLYREYNLLLFRIPLKIKEIKQTTTQQKTTRKFIEYITEKYGSVIGFKLLKYFLEHKLAREKHGFAVYELTFNIPPSLLLTRKTLIKIQCLADDSDQKDSEEGLDLLIQKGILNCDPKTEILELAVPLKSIADVYLKETDQGFEVVEDMSQATMILLPTKDREAQMKNSKEKLKINVAGVPDMLRKSKNGKYKIVENKFVGASKRLKYFS